LHNFHRASILLFCLEIEVFGGFGAFNLVVRVVEGFDFLAEEGVVREVLWLLLDIVGLLLTHLHPLSLIVEEFEEDTAKCFHLVEGARLANLGMLRQVNIFSFLYTTVKFNAAAVCSDIRIRKRGARLAEYTVSPSEEATGAC
jgi:hypothetical protein